jgi:hypothetical protein
MRVLRHQRTAASLVGKVPGWADAVCTLRRRQSGPAEVPSGVIQVSVLGPLLFNIYGADLPSAIKSSTLVQYADDCTLYKEVVVEDTDSIEEMQEDLENVAIWCANNGMTEILKCNVIVPKPQGSTQRKISLDFECFSDAKIL